METLVGYALVVLGAALIALGLTGGPAAAVPFCLLGTAAIGCGILSALSY